MIKKIILIIFLISFYIFLVSSDPKGNRNIFNSVKKIYNFFVAKYRDMDLEYHIKTWSKKDKKKFY